MHAAPADANANLIKPFAVLAAVAFVVGFLGYLAVARTDMATLQARMTAPTVARAAAPEADADVWNLPKKI